MTERAPCVILGSGNIGTDLMAKLRRSDVLELAAMVGIDPASDGLRPGPRAPASRPRRRESTGSWRAADPSELVFDATSADAHRAHAAAPRRGRAASRST